MSFNRTAALILIAAVSTAAQAAEYTLAQKNKAFTQKELKIKVGDRVKFVNNDSVYHNVFSLSDTQTFDLGTYGPGESRSLKFGKPGKVIVECAIHKNMMMTVDVSK